MQYFSGVGYLHIVHFYPSSVNVFKALATQHKIMQVIPFVQAGLVLFINLGYLWN